MKSLLAFAVLAAPTAGFACVPPVPETYTPAELAEREIAYREMIRRTPNIVYGVVERPITPDRDSRGVLRVLHAYQGRFRVDQRLRMRYVILPGGCPQPYDFYVAPRGHYGVLLIGNSDADGIFDFQHFLQPEAVERLIGEGLIQSARRATEQE